MTITKEQYLVDESGNRIAVLLDIAECRRLLEELEAIRAYDAAKAAPDEALPFEEAIKEIEQHRQ